MKTGALILLVEDDRDIRDSFADALGDEGHTVTRATDGLDALECLRSGARPSLILLDLMMPRMDGLRFRAEVSKAPEWADIPIVVMTADVRAKAQTIGVRSFLRKPIHLRDLLNTVNHVLADAC